MGIQSWEDNRLAHGLLVMDLASLMVRWSTCHRCLHQASSRPLGMALSPTSPSSLTEVWFSLFGRPRLSMQATESHWSRVLSVLILLALEEVVSPSAEGVTKKSSLCQLGPILLRSRFRSTLSVTSGHLPLVNTRWNVQMTQVLA